MEIYRRMKRFFQNPWQRCRSECGGKRFASDLAVPLLVILVGFGSFGLGRLSALETQKHPISVTQTASVGAMVSESEGMVVGSKTGTKYHFPWCSGAMRMKEENKVWFESVEKARQAGYLPAGNCKGLDGGVQ
jgi:hypothetical protein